MKLNIFSIPTDKVTKLKEKLLSVKMEAIHSAEVEGWNTTFFFSKTPDPVEIPWLNHYPEIFGSELKPTNNVYYGTYLWERGATCFGLSFGKSHFYLRQYSDSDFGLQIATRIGNKEDVTQKAARKFVGNKKREVRSYAKDSPIDIESGESVDYIQSAIIEEHQGKFGKIGKFGTSLLLTIDVDANAIPHILNDISEIRQAEQKFKLPKIEIIKDEGRISIYDTRLVNRLMGSIHNAAFNDESHYIVGIDFIFPSNQRYALKFHHIETPELESVDIPILKRFVDEHNISKNEILDIRVKVMRDDARSYSRTLKQSLEFVMDDERVMLADGEWKEFNEDYLNQLHKYIDEVIVIDTALEDSLKEVDSDEPTFNLNIQQFGYVFADKNYDILKLPGHKIEAWDFNKGKASYAVKFGNAQELGYVCGQAVNVLELMRNVPGVRSVLDCEEYCLWLVMERGTLPAKLSDISSIIFKQKLEDWARKCRELGIKPTVRLSKRIRSSN
jgi:uncharacterized protein (TIGR04141 family)